MKCFGYGFYIIIQRMPVLLVSGKLQTNLHHTNRINSAFYRPKVVHNIIRYLIRNDCNLIKRRNWGVQNFIPTEIPSTRNAAKELRCTDCQIYGLVRLRSECIDPTVVDTDFFVQLNSLNNFI